MQIYEAACYWHNTVYPFTVNFLVNLQNTFYQLKIMVNTQTINSHL